MQKNKKIKILLAVVFVIIVFFVLFFWLFSARNVIVTGCEYYSEEDIKKKLMTKPTDHNAVLFWMRYYFGKGNHVPFIQRADVELKGMDTVEITVYEKRMTGCIRNMSEYIYFDKDGSVMEVSKDKLSGITQFTGLGAKSYSLYEQLKVDDEEIFHTILSFSQMIERYSLPIDRVHISKINGVVMYSGEVRILLGKQDMYDQAVAELNHMLPKVLELGQAGEINMKNFESGQSTTIFRPDEDDK